ncbi:discoidin domain-containing protein [Streptomyces sp. ISL-94]|uniref:discoidin domain-containing protein n=1 Tax=Streptomyces sp. ISL-94 TaxID=2819190 RepID=UPI0027E50323|nr:discoidin domain-containing protein [Streptomyces sp. ISL-94]
MGLLVQKLPVPWGTRTQTLSVLGSTDGSTWTTLKASAGYTFTEGGNTVTVPLSAAEARYLRLTFTGNTGWPAGQLAQVEA